MACTKRVISNTNQVFLPVAQIDHRFVQIGYTAQNHPSGRLRGGSGCADILMQTLSLRFYTCREDKCTVNRATHTAASASLSTCNATQITGPVGRDECAALPPTIGAE